MYSKLLNILNESTENSLVGNISDFYDSLYHEYTTLQDLNTVDHGQGPAMMEDADFLKVKSMLDSGVDIVEAFTGVMPVSMLSNVEKVLSKYKGEIEDIVKTSKNVDQFVATLEDRLPTMVKGDFQGKEFTLEDLNNDIKNGGI